MSETISRQSGAVTDAAVLDQGSGAFGWRRLQLIASAGAAASLILPMVIEGTFAGFLAAMAAPFIVGLVLAIFLPRTAAIFLGVVSTAILLSSLPFLVGSLVHPESPQDFIPLVLLVLATTIAAVAGIPAFKEARTHGATSRMPRAILTAAVAVLVVASAVSVVSAAGLDSVTAQSGDITMTARDFVFTPGQITAEAGTVTVHLTNADQTRHTFTIDGMVDVSVAPGHAQRATFEAQPGTYRFYCEPHSPGMAGTLVVE
jgi:plastocyanin